MPVIKDAMRFAFEALAPTDGSTTADWETHTSTRALPPPPKIKYSLIAMSSHEQFVDEDDRKSAAKREPSSSASCLSCCAPADSELLEDEPTSQIELIPIHEHNPDELVGLKWNVVRASLLYEHVSFRVCYLNDEPFGMPLAPNGKPPALLIALSNPYGVCRVASAVHS